MSLRRTTPLIALIALFGLSACETFKGMGRDVQGAGQAVSTSAAEVQEGM
ncbi:MAG: entericidin A/B family lipoprotein [Cypionkella sp.]|jgi:entericidin B